MRSRDPDNRLTAPELREAYGAVCIGGESSPLSQRFAGASRSLPGVSADLVLQIYIFHFGLAQGSGLDFFGKVEFAATLKNPKTDESLQIQAAGTSIANAALRKKNIQKNVQANIEGALEDAVRNLLRGTQLREAVASLLKNTPSAPAAAPKGGVR